MIKMVIFDLDDTIIDTKSFEYYRKEKRWDKVDDSLNNFNVLFDAKEVIEGLQEKGIIIIIVTTSPKEKYAIKILNHFNINIVSNNIYGYGDLMSYKVNNNFVPLKTGVICHIKKEFNIENDEIIFVGDSENDFMACACTNIPFISLKNSIASNFFDNKLINIENSYCELFDIIEELNNSEYCIHKREHEYIGDFFTFSNYIKDIFTSGEDLGIPRKISYDSMHARILDLKNNNMKSAVNWLYLVKKLPLEKYFVDVDFVVRALGSEECTFNSNRVRTLDLVGFYIASRIEAQFKPTLLTKKSPNEKLHLSGKNREERKKIIEGNYESSLVEENKTVLVIDDIVTTGVTLEEIERAFIEKMPTTKIKFSTIAETVSYNRKSYLENIFNSRFFYCGNDIFEKDKYATFISILGTYLYNYFPDEKRRVHSSGKYITYIMDVSDIIILNKKQNKFAYCVLVLNDENIVINEKTILDFFDDLNDCKPFKNPRAKQFIKDTIKQLFDMF